MRKKIFIDEKPSHCPSQLRAIHDTMDLLDGKWKITIIGCLSFGNKRFMDLQREVEGIGSKMLSKELQELEINGLVSRTVMNTRPVTVEYALTSYGQTLRPILWEMAKWGQTHRKKIFSANEDPES
ncbi:helix-turn-helix domain-containing protein [Cytophagaceae bacterium DM2B3-1]|uniref:Helix-turn-helix domain-containing protein n=1 Tax=Xanthocytophaga flava TaxID=3048013 RepID=A0ABT7CY71_9BACT|nr:helix-turn-helix domain-containing protein [Xanthocytophaga flavus]MDJ1498721.1 helix-turn-helix domain-containing protein [Xanthocytophaga flavus]